MAIIFIYDLIEIISHIQNMFLAFGISLRRFLRLKQILLSLKPDDLACCTLHLFVRTTELFQVGPTFHSINVTHKMIDFAH